MTTRVGVHAKSAEIYIGWVLKNSGDHMNLFASRRPININKCK